MFQSNSDSNIALQVETIVREVVDSLLPDRPQISGGNRESASPTDRQVPISISARHLHIKQEDLETLFGSGYHLTKLTDLFQPGEFASNETVTIVGPNRRVFEKVRILGPTRKFTQVEMSFTDGRYLGMDLPLRISGDLKGSAPIVIVGPVGVLQLKEGAIRAMRHVHMSDENAVNWGLKNGQSVSIQTKGPIGLTFGNVVVRTGPNLKLEMHIDTDEANAAGLSLENNMGVLI